jgi:hypothetical protein
MTGSHTSRDVLPEDTFTLPGGGHVNVALPTTLSQAEYEELRDWLELMRKKAERKIVDRPDAAVRASSPSEEGDVGARSADDADSLSWE